MKAITYVNKMLITGECSIHQVAKLNEALHREKLIADNIMIRFKPLFAEFDIVSSDWFMDEKINCTFYSNIGNIDKLVVFVNALYEFNKEC